MDINIFVDMDGVLTKVDPEIEHNMYNVGYFLEAEPVWKNIQLVQQLLNDKNLHVYILSSLLAKSNTIEQEKDLWLDKYLPEIKKSHRFFVPEGIKKCDFIRAKIPDVDYAVNLLIDDYSVNLQQWKEFGYIGIKMLNGFNNRHGTWINNNPESILHYEDNPEHNYMKLTKLMTKKRGGQIN